MKQQILDKTVMLIVQYAKGNILLAFLFQKNQACQISGGWKAILGCWI